MFPTLTPATRAIILANVAVFLLELAAMRPILWYFALWPLAPGSPFHWWQLVTYAFLHDGFLHIFFNMFALYVFGPGLEQYWGARRYLAYYFVCVVAAGATQLAVERFFGGLGAAARLRGPLPARAAAALFRDPRARVAVRHRIRRAGALLRRHRHGSRHRPLRAPRRHARRRPHDALLAPAPRSRRLATRMSGTFCDGPHLPQPRR
jgi:membrane associated rhomboid family serine protease